MSFGRDNDFSINTILGPGSSISGDIESGGFTRIDGSIRGNLSVKGRVVVGERARMKSNISGTTVTIGGVVHGNILASERIVILNTGLILGDLITRRIQADDGCLVHGKITVCQSDEAWDRAVAEYRDSQGVKSALSGVSFHPKKDPDTGQDEPPVRSAPAALPAGTHG
jgi:cytoskeletal protein CcmA (bactofilin family)